MAAPRNAFIAATKSCEKLISPEHLSSFLNDLYTALKDYILRKEILLEKEARDGGREFTVRKAVNPKALFRFLGSLNKNSNHEVALNQRLILLAYAKYLKGRIHFLLNKSSAITHEECLALINEFTLQHAYLKQTKIEGSLIHIIENAIFLAKQLFAGYAIQSYHESETSFRILWPIFLATEDDPINFFKQKNFSADYALSIADIKDVAINSSLDLTSFQHILNQLEFRLSPILEHIPRDLTKEKSNELHFAAQNALDEEVIKLKLGKGMSLSKFFKFSDEHMGMKLDPKRFSEFTIEYISENGIFNKKNEKLEDSWYQYVIIAENQYRHDMRYFPCADNSLGYIPYSKYVAHSEIAGDQAIFASGAFKIENAKIVILDDASGHYGMTIAHLEYAKKRLELLGQQNVGEIKIQKAEPLSISQMADKGKRKISALAYGLWSAANPDKPQHAEGRVIPPKKLQGTHLHNQRNEDYAKILEAMRGMLNTLSSPSSAYTR